MNKTVAQYTPEERRKRIFGIVGAASGNLVEWFDFYIYAVFATYFTVALTGPQDGTKGSFLVWGAFALSFFMRPLGSWLFGWIADKYGRKKSMLISIVMMGAGSFCFAILPTYEQVGIWAPILLLLVRMFQGLSVGGEYGAVATYMSEVALRGRRGFYASFQYVTLSGGQLLASLLGVVLLTFLSTEQLEAGAWRIPFFIGGLAALVSLWVRRTIDETTTAEQRESKESGSLIALFRGYWKQFLLVVGYTAGGSLAFYTITVYSRNYMIGMGVDHKVVGYIMTAGLFVFMISQPLFGAIGDRIGRRASMLLFSALGFLAIFPIMGLAMPAMKDSVWMLGILLVLMLFILSFYTSISGLVKAEMFPTEVRALGVGLSYAFGNAMFGGTAVSIATEFKNIGHAEYFFIYVSIMLVVCFFCSFALPKEPEYLENDH
ncbi:MFS transporter [Ignatzschineria sp. LJL83]